MNLIPINKNVIVEKIENEANKNGIIIPDSLKSDSNKGKVIQLSKNVEFLPAVDNLIVHFGKFAGLEIEYEGKKYLKLQESEIFAYEEINS